MNELILSILLNAYIGIIFVFFNRYKIDLLQAIVFNYITCVVTGSLVLGRFPINTDSIATPWFQWALMMGTLFISILNIIAISSIKVGVTITQTANKLSLIIPVLFAWYFYQETIHWIKWTGIFIALIAVIFTIWKSNTKNFKKSFITFFLPLFIFLGSGVLDTLTKYVEKNYIKNEAIANSYIIACFATASFIGLILLGILFLLKKKTFHIKNVIAGVILGVPNYFSIYFLIMALKNNHLSSSAVIPINNIGVLFLVSLFGILIFKEKMTRLNYVGLLLSIIAILFIYFGDIY